MTSLRQDERGALLGLLAAALFAGCGGTAGQTPRQAGGRSDASGTGVASEARTGAMEASPSHQRPNVVLILADDLGYAEIGVQGCKDVPTPHIDSIAREGVRFTSGYVSCPVCSPTRAGLLTGRYQQRFGHEFNPHGVDQAGEDFGLLKSEPTLPERLKALGYATGMFGKWHLGAREDARPTRRGFDAFVGFLGGAHPYLKTDIRGDQPILRGDDPIAVDFTTETFAGEAAGFIRRRRDRPFFVYLPFNAVHMPLQVPEKYLERFASIADRKRRTFAAMLSALDDGVGTVLAALREAGLERDTLVFFLSDNGGPTGSTTSRNDPLRGFKAQVHEGGIRVPFLARWPGRLPAGVTVDEPVISLDIAATALAAAGRSGTFEPPLDGVDLVPFLTGNAKAPPHDRLFWRFGPAWAIRMGDWKLASADGKAAALYNLREDIGESRDLAAARPQRVSELRAAWDAWNRELAEPRWGERRK